MFDIDKNAEVSQFYLTYFVARINMTNPNTFENYTQAMLSIYAYGSWAYDNFANDYIDVEGDVEMLLCTPKSN
jgi:hypothetical protein